MKNLVSLYAWSVGGLYFGILCLLTVLLSFFIKPEKYDRWLKKNLGLLFKILFIKVESEGAENIEPDRTYLFMSNH